jgi:DNA (cytosine-5)-methyltransferase 1
VDTTQTITHIGLCAGYGGIELGLQRVIPTLRSVALCEIEAFACANLVAKMEAGLMDCAPIWTDLKTFPWAEFRDRVDILTGGYPCQPFSAAGKRAGKDDPRHLWPFISAGIAAMRPSVCFFENVEGHISLGLPDVIEDLAGMGYRTTWGIFSASEVGAPHQRKRVFILAYRNEPGWEARWHNAISSQGRQPHELAACGGDQRGAEELADSIMRGMSRSRNELGDIGEAGQGRTHLEANSHIAWPSRPGEPQHEWEPPRVVKPSLGGDPARDSGGVDYAELCISCDNRADELRLLGNGVVPATAERAFRILMQELVG